MHAHAIPPMVRTLGALSAILTKAEAQCAPRRIDPGVVLGLRLAPDMLNFTKQIQLACDFSVRPAARLAQAALPSFPDTESSFDALRARISAARAFLEALPATAFEGADGRQITIKVRSTEMTMTGLEFLTVYTLPQFYFHVTTAYATLRSNGFDIGKGDYMAA